MADETTTAPEMPEGVFIIPGYWPEPDEKFDVHFTCRECLKEQIGVELTLSGCDDISGIAGIADHPCVLNDEHVGQWNIELGWVGRWDDDEEQDNNDDTEDYEDVE